MKYKITVECEEVDDFRRDILIDEDATFLELSNTILKSCGYPDDQMTSFYVCEDNWERREQVTRMDCSDGYFNARPMAETSLADVLDDGYTRMEYIFDPYNERAFLLRVKGEVQGYGEPEVVRSEGKAPQQVKEFSAVASVGKDDNFDFSELSGDGFNSDEIDPEGFEISDTLS